MKKEIFNHYFYPICWVKICFPLIFTLLPKKKFTKISNDIQRMIVNGERTNRIKHGKFDNLPKGW